MIPSVGPIQQDLGSIGWYTPDKWPGLPSGFDRLQFIRYEGMDANTGYIWYKTAPISDKFAKARQSALLGGDRYQIHIFCGEHDVFSAAQSVINNHKDARKSYEWDVTGPTWLGTNKLMKCSRLRDFIVECQTEFASIAGGSMLEVKSMEYERFGTRHCFIRLRRWGKDSEAERRSAVLEIQELFYSMQGLEEPSWDKRLGDVQCVMQARGLLKLPRSDDC